MTTRYSGPQAPARRWCMSICVDRRTLLGAAAKQSDAVQRSDGRHQRHGAGRRPVQPEASARFCRDSPDTWGISGTISRPPRRGNDHHPVRHRSSTTANASGNYLLTGVPNGTYVVTPSKSGYAYSPPNKPSRSTKPTSRASASRRSLPLRLDSPARSAPPLEGAARQ